MNSFKKRTMPGIFSWVLALVIIPVVASPTRMLSQDHIVNATIDTTRTGAPNSKNIYEQFLEHGGDIVNTGVWSEMLVDRKFCPPPLPCVRSA